MKRILRGLLVLYCVSLGASHCVRRGVTEGTAPEGARRVTLPEWNRDEKTGRRIHLAYRDTRQRDRPALVLLHGSPVASTSLTPLMAELNGQARLIVPDLPGFGGSTLRIADYSTRSHARNTLDLLDHLGIEEAHLLGYSMGGGVALQMVKIAPDRVKSIALVSSIGVQELELLGDYTLNHAVHGLQLVALALLQEGVPHFGILDRFPLNRSHARNFFDTDQRPFRRYLRELEHPTLIVHGTDDFLVPYAAAREHYRLVPQSILLPLEGGNHITVIREPQRVAPGVIDFLRRVESGGVPQRDEAVERLALAAEPFRWHRPVEGAWRGALLMMILLALATFVTEDLTCIGAGLLVSRGAIGFFPATLACLMGILLGDVLLYLAGRWFGPPALRRAPLKWMIKPHQVERCAAFFQRQGPALVFATRFVPGTRLPTYFATGMFRAPFWKFVGWFLLAAAIWTPLLVGLAHWIGGPLLDWFAGFGRYALLGLGAVVFLLWMILRIGVPMFTHRGRRLLLSSWRRKTRWEFWPPLIFYSPVVAYNLCLAFRHRSLTLFTAANPAIPQGGLVRESKSRILRGLGDQPEMARWRLLAAGEVGAMMSALESFMEGESLTCPLVLKPDVGQRGAGVRIIRSREDARAYFRTAKKDIIAQEYIPGREFGVFYYRYPEEEEGRIFSITDKRLISVTGDGERTLEELILDDDRAVCLAPFFMVELGAQLTQVPSEGQVVPLTDLGTHCRGALFLEGTQLRTEALRQTIHRISRAYEGFYFGRYDIRVPSEEDLQAGRNIRVLELNGVTSESTNIYDPKNTLWTAYGTLFEQWRIAFEIGKRNCANGARPAGLREMWRLMKTSLG